MAQRVVVHFAARERELVQEVLHNADVAGGLAFGEVDQDGLERLRKAGVVVEEAGRRGDVPHPPAPSPNRATKLFLPELRRLTARLPRRVSDTYAVALAGPLLPQWRDELEAAGAKLLQHQGGRTFTARIGAGGVDAIEQLRFVDAVRQYTATDTIDTGYVMTVRPEPERFEALLHSEDDLPAVEKALAHLGIDVELVAGRKIRFSAVEPADLVVAARLPGVASLYEYVEPTAANDRAREIVGVEPPGAPPVPWTGEGQIVAVADSGIDADHPDLAGCVLLTIARARPGDPSDLDGHGTHVTGTLAGDGSASGGALRGIAPGAKVVFQSIADTDGTFSGIEPTMVDVLQEAYAAGARIHNDSWAIEGNASAYRAPSDEVDQFVHENRDMLVVVAAGNDGTAGAPGNPTPGWVGLKTISSPGSAKNALTVGACRSDRPAPGTPPPTYGTQWATKFPHPPTSEEPVSGDVDRLAAFSGRGPCEDARIKPDLVAPGTFVLSARASTAAQDPWAPGPTAEYAYEGGTSTAAPVAAGSAALARQYLIDEHGHEPSAALLKAILINGTVRLGGPDAIAAPDGDPNYHQGFGRLSLAGSLPTAGEPGFGLTFYDDWKNPAPTIANSGSGVRFSVSITADRPLRVCLAWSDPAGRAVQNCLGLRVRHVASESEWFGNGRRPQTFAGGMDDTNNVQIVRPEEAVDGDIEVWVEGLSLTRPGQHIAVVVTGALASLLTLEETY